jgi:GR25 family glycosyltransferase involved in LPS biosynthesis
MIDVYIVGLDSDYRGQRLEEKLMALGFNPVRVSAVDLRGINLRDLDLNLESIKLWNGRYLSSGEIGCQISHRKAWEIANKNNSPWSIILEDDAIVDDSFLNFASEVTILKSKKPAIISGYWPYAIARKSVSLDLIPKKPRLLRKVIVPPYSTVCYAINSAAIRRHLEMDELRVTASDWPLMTFTIDFYVYMKRFVYHPDLHSTIGIDRDNEQEISSGYFNGYIATNSEKITSLLHRLLSIRRLLKLSKHPKPFAILVKKFIYTLYYIQILKSIPGLEILSGDKTPLLQNRISLKEISKIIKFASLHTAKWFYWKSRNYASAFYNPLVVRARRLGSLVMNRRFRAIVVRFKLLKTRSKIKAGMYPEYIQRNYDLFKVFPKVAKTPSSKIFQKDLKSFSCILNVYNQYPSELERALKSILGQVQQFDQVIIYDDGSDELETVAWLEGLHERSRVLHGRIQIIRASNLGVVEARNLAFKYCDAEWVLFLDGDDQLLIDYLGNVSKILNRYPTAEIIYPDYLISSDKGAPTRSKSGPAEPDYLIRINTLPHSSFIKSSLFLELQGYDLAFSELGAEDWAFWIKACLHGARFAPLGEAGYVYFKNQEDSRSSLTDHFVQERILAIEQLVIDYKATLS